MLQIPRLKLCTKCKIIKPFNMFHKNKCKKNGLTPSCKKCRKIYRDKESNKEYIKQYYKKNKQKINKTRKQYNHKNREKINKASREYHHKNKEKRNEVSREYRHKNKEEISKQRKEYYKENKEELNKVSREYHHKNKEKLNKESRAYYNKNKEEMVKKSRDYRKKNRKEINRKRRDSPEAKIANRINQHKRRELKRQNKLNKDEVQLLISNTEVCYWCNCKLNGKYHIDHYIPVAKGGLNVIENLVISCPACNMSKGAKDPHEFAKTKGRLL